MKLEKRYYNFGETLVEVHLSRPEHLVIKIKKKKKTLARLMVISY